MKRITKLLLGIAGFLLMSGALLCVTGRVMGAETSLSVNYDGYTMQVRPFGIRQITSWDGWEYGDDWDDWEDYGEQYGGKYHNSSADFTINSNISNRTLSSLDPITQIDIESNIADVIFVEGDSYGVELMWYNPKLEMDCDYDDGMLSVWSVYDNVNNLNNIKTGRVIVYLPRDAQLEQVYVSVNMADIEIDGWNMDSGTVTNNMGKITLKNLTASSLDLSLNMGNLEVRNCTVTDELTASNNMGKIDVSGDLGGAIELDNDMGEIRFVTSRPISEFGYDLSTSMGCITIDGKDYKERAYSKGGDSFIEADNSMSNINLTFGA